MTSEEETTFIQVVYGKGDVQFFNLDCQIDHLYDQLYEMCGVEEGRLDLATEKGKLLQIPVPSKRSDSKQWKRNLELLISETMSSAVDGPPSTANATANKPSSGKGQHQSRARTSTQVAAPGSTKPKEGNGLASDYLKANAVYVPVLLTPIIEKRVRSAKSRPTSTKSSKGTKKGGTASRADDRNGTSNGNGNNPRGKQVVSVMKLKMTPLLDARYLHEMFPQFEIQHHHHRGHGSSTNASASFSSKKSNQALSAQKKPSKPSTK
eukprot:m.12226 g.12226  ORF g.12226 m.12226 type:complete len:265 (+) comp3967_c0_seq1:150-944(+)